MIILSTARRRSCVLRYRKWRTLREHDGIGERLRIVQSVAGRWVAILLTSRIPLLQFYAPHEDEELTLAATLGRWFRFARLIGLLRPRP